MTDKVNALLTAQANNSRFEVGKKTRTVEFEASVTAANSDAGDLFILAKGLSFSDRISGLRANSAGTPAFTSATDNDLGFYYENEDGTYTELDKDILWDGVSLATAKTDPNLLTSLNAALSHDQSIGELLGLGVDDEPARGVLLVMTMNTANTATGPLLFRLAIDIDEATTN